MGGDYPAGKVDLGQVSPVTELWRKALLLALWFLFWFLMWLSLRDES